MFMSIQIRSMRPKTYVLGVWQDSKRVSNALSPWNGVCLEAIASPNFSGKRGETTIIGSVLFVGLGKKGALKRDDLRSLGGSVVRALGKAELRSVSINLHLTIPQGIANEKELGQLVAEGMTIASWRVDQFDGSATKRESKLGALQVTSKSKKVLGGLTRGVILGNAVNDARRIAATPPNICNPPWMAKEAKKIATKCGLKCSVISYAQAVKLGLNGIVNVGKGSQEKPCLIILEHNPRKKKNRDEHLCLVGKTITYDTGGYSLKISNGMKGMKYDKNGGMGVLGAMEAIANLNVPARVTAILPCAENMVSSNAYRPDDIIEMYNGVTVEVTNTDAEGRLVLADGLAWACKQIKPTKIVDMATLTGGVVVALGSFCAGLWCNNAKLKKQIESASKNTGERVWELPLWEDHRDYMRAKHADLHNSAPARGAHPIQGAAFLSFFVDKDIPWAHIDIAGVSSVERDRGLYCTGPTGWGVRLLAELAESQ
ncbi:MAG TPA: leucyl aminopeptidase family protein [Phycisphaerales bacterium]|nr:leucyl aminopeptidase family protein [Phycisphaerales bacterium]HIB50284.1 leucyl aminopeptidase family protein [Phycisphaerales bacterium]HIN83879.1 leucyl aminopeptidase family protein [Phycisphaerales bacterium]HIO20526.1 leucyl aminopeptidase family protein [Phycisphaerales bacterium]HIO52288.1 leucyl aminopeptidase family protein [Phycisphaerales bacterium]